MASPIQGLWRNSTVTFALCNHQIHKKVQKNWGCSGTCQWLNYRPILQQLSSYSSMQGYDFEYHQDSQNKMYIVTATSISRDKHSPHTMIMCFCKGVMPYSLLKTLKVIVKAMIIKHPLIWPLDCWQIWAVFLYQ